VNDLVVRAPAQLTAQTRAAFREEAIRALERWDGQPNGGLVIDLTGTTRVDSTGLGALAAVQARAAERKLQVRLRGVSEEFRLLLVLTRLEDRFVIEGEAP
jgi:anti-anti-sigma factor